MDLVIEYKFLKYVYDKIGSEKFFELFECLFPEFELYTMSTDWTISNEYILKFKGASGDIIVSWK
jgi:hypothetical protein